MKKYAGKLKCFDAESPIALYGDSESADYQQLVIQRDQCNSKERSDCEESLDKFRNELSGKKVLLIANMRYI